jgi:hypothetical protein
VALLALSLPSGAHAQASVEGAASMEHDAYERGVAAFDRGEPDVALHVFRELHERTGLPALRFNIGICLEQLGERVDALVEFEAVGENDAIDAGTRAEAIEAAARLRALLATVTVDGPPGDVAVLDGARRCELPCELYVEPGAHRVVLASTEAEAETFEVGAGGRAAVTLTVEAASSPSLGVLTGLGAAIAAVGAGGIIGFGVRTLDVKAAFEVTPTAELQSEGTTMRDLANLSIGVAALGGVLVLIDVVLVATGSGARDAQARIEGGELVLAF